MANEFPADWKSYKLDELGFVGRGKSKHRPRNDPVLYNGMFPFIQTGDVKAANFYLKDYSQTYNEAGLKQSKLWEKGTLCITIAANIAETAILDIKACFPDSIIGFVPDTSKTTSAYIKYYVDYIKLQMQQISQGTTQDNLSAEKLLSFNFIIPDITEQQKIVSILTSYNDLIENNNRRIAILEEMARSLYREWFVKYRFSGHEDVKMVDSELGQIPEGWEIVSLVDIADFLNGLAMQKYRPMSEEFLPVIKIRELRQGFTETTEKARLDLDQKYIVNNGDILFSWSGSLECVLWAFGKGALNQHLFKVTPKIYPKWFSYFSIHSHLEYFRQIAAMKAISMGHINREHLQRAKTLLPSQELISQVDISMSTIFNQIVNLSKRNQNLKTQRDMLLPKLISGKIKAI